MSGDVAALCKVESEVVDAADTATESLPNAVKRFMQLSYSTPWQLIAGARLLPQHQLKKELSGH
jgi:hypothetical protein